MNVLVIDVGTSSMRGILFDHCGYCLSEEQRQYQAEYLEDSRVEQDPEQWVDALYSIVKKTAQRAKKERNTIDAVVLTSQRSSVIPVDREIKPLCHAIMWQDKRTNAICESRKHFNGEIFELCGSRVNPVFSGPKMTWIREERPEIYEKTYKFMVISDYLLYHMTGRICTDYTYGSRSLLMNIRTHRWDQRLLEIFNVEKERLCELVEPGSVCGYVTEAFAAETGCPAGIPVITAGGDQQCGAIGQGVVRPGVLSVTTGTGGYLVTETEGVPENMEQDVICNCSSIGGQYILESSVLTCCSAFDWFRKEFFPGRTFDEINRLIEGTPVGANGCLCVPHFMGRSTPDWNNMAKGVFADITLKTTKQDMLRSLLEGICFEIRNGIDIMNKYVQVSDICINGGLSNSGTFNEIQANVYNKKIIRRGKDDATARGALMIATAALGQYENVEKAFEQISKKDEIKVYVPDAEKVKEYERCRARMNQIYRDISQKGRQEWKKR